MYVCLSMYVSIYVSTYVWIYVTMYVCMYLHTYRPIGLSANYAYYRSLYRSFAYIEVQEFLGWEFRPAL